ncbi:MAG: M20/M25/M40 family metallo-hydrolase, partial [Pseudomonadota bacterium]
MADYTTTLHALSRLIGFDTISRLSNLALIDWADEQLTAAGARCTRIPDATGEKANLWARIGPEVSGGLVLSGHTDVVPVDGQPWDTDPFELTERDGRLFGRGTCDMKAFLALCIAFAPRFAAANLARPVHIALSHDEEVGCLGAPAMIDAIMASGAAPAGVWVGEPTNWQVISQHKGIAAFEVTVTGREAHSSLPDQGVSAIMEALH